MFDHLRIVLLAAALLVMGGQARAEGNVIFIHPDGASSGTWAAARALYVGPDGDLNWDRMPVISVYRGHMADSLTATSNGGATTHATGLKVESDAFGRYRAGDNAPRLEDAQGRSLSVARQALDAGLKVGLVQTGIASEPGTAVFLADAAQRGDHEQIVAQLIESGAHVLLSGGEKHFLPEGEQGVHGPGVRKDGRNLFQEARERGYTVVRTRGELLSIPAGTQKLLGVFSQDATFNAATEEQLEKQGLPLYFDAAPTVAEMTAAALEVLSHGEERFLLVVEEEGTDNFGNANNADGTLEAARRADRAIGVAQQFLQTHPQTLLLTAADSDGGGLRMKGIVVGDGHEVPETLPAQSSNGSPIDGVGGTGGRPYLAAPDRNGLRLPFYVTWNHYSDISGAILLRAQGLNSQHVGPSADNTRIAELTRLTLFGAPHAAPQRED